MHKNTPSHDHDPVEQDAVWELISRSPAHTAGPRFADDVVRTAKLEGIPTCGFAAWRMRWLSPAPAMALGGIAAALVAGWFVTMKPTTDHQAEPHAMVLDAAAEEENLAHLQEVLETELLFAAVEHLDDFSDADLITLIGF